MAKNTSGGTPATTALRAAGVTFREHTYRHDPRAHSFGLEAAQALGVDASRVFKTIVVDVDGADLAAVVAPVSGLVDLKAAARALGAKRVDLADAALAQRATGYVVGGISPFGGRRRLRTVLDASAESCATIFVSGGRRGFDVEVSPADLVRLLDAAVEPITRP